MIEDADKESKQFHAYWQRLTGRTIVAYDISARAHWERWIFEAKKRGWGGKDLKAVVYHIKDRAGSWKTPQLRLRDLLDIQTFQDNLAEVKVRNDEIRSMPRRPSTRDQALIDSGRLVGRTNQEAKPAAKTMEELKIQGQTLGELMRKATE